MTWFPFLAVSSAALNSAALVLQCGRVSTFLLCTFLRRKFWTHTLSRQLPTPVDAAGQFPFSNVVVSMCVAHPHHEFWLLHSLTRNATFDSAVLHPKPISFFFPSYLTFVAFLLRRCSAAGTVSLCGAFPGYVPAWSPCKSLSSSHLVVHKSSHS